MCCARLQLHACKKITKNASAICLMRKQKECQGTSQSSIDGLLYMATSPVRLSVTSLKQSMSNKREPSSPEQAAAAISTSNIIMRSRIVRNRNLLQQLLRHKKITTVSQSTRSRGKSIAKTAKMKCCMKVTCDACDCAVHLMQRSVTFFEVCHATCEL